MKTTILTTASLLFLLPYFTTAHSHNSHIPKLSSRSGAAIPWNGLYTRQAIGAEKVTTDGTCGNIAGGKGLGMECAKQGRNLCCGPSGFCGDTDGHCGTGCQPEFGICKSSISTPPPPSNNTSPHPPTSTSPPSNNSLSPYNDTSPQPSTNIPSNSPTNESPLPASPSPPRKAPSVERCGPANNNAKCINNECCSSAGFCGVTGGHCVSPDCLSDFGRCDSSVIPKGLNTSSVPRPELGNIPYGSDIFACKNAGDVALTYDDGPFNFTDRMLDVLDKYSAKATFFITGINKGKGAIDEPQFGWDKVIKRMHKTGHQIASHTWSHANLSAISESSRRDEMVKLEMALRNIVGVIPTYMRPPFSACDDDCLETMKDLGYHVTYFDLDTEDTLNVSPNEIQKSKDVFASELAAGDPRNDEFLAIGHDISEQTALNLTEFMLKTLTERGYKAVTVGECLGDPKEFWYRSDSGSTPTPNQKINQNQNQNPPALASPSLLPTPTTHMELPAAPTNELSPEALFRAEREYLENEDNGERQDRNILKLATIGATSAASCIRAWPWLVAGLVIGLGFVC